MLPKLPNVPEKVKPRPHFAYVFMEPIVPKFAKTTIKLSQSQQQEIAQEEAQERVKQVLQKGSMRRAIVIALPADVDTKKFPMQKGDVVGVPFGEYDIINMDRTVIHMVGLYDLSILPDLTPEECEKWDKDQEVYINDVVYAEKEDSKVIKLK